MVYTKANQIFLVLYIKTGFKNCNAKKFNVAARDVFVPYSQRFCSVSSNKNNNIIASYNLNQITDEIRIVGTFRAHRESDNIFLCAIEGH